MRIHTSSATVLLRLTKVQERTGLSRSSIYQLIAEDRFPKQVALSSRAVAWIESDIENWVRSRVAASTCGGAA